MANSGASISFNPKHDIPPLDGKVILITGGNNGIGKESALALSEHNPAEIWIAARNSETGQRAVDEVRAKAPGVSVRFLELDLASLGSVKNAAAVFLASAARLDILMLNAGIMGAPAGMTEDGYEVQFGTNHMGHAMLVKLLMPMLLRSAADGLGHNIRVVSLSSGGHAHVSPPGIHFETLKSKGETLSALDRYCQSKLANLLYAQELARRVPSITAVAIHPGSVKTDLFSASKGGWVMRGLQVLSALTGVSAEEGAKNQLWAATAEGVRSGEYYEPVGVAGKGSALSKDEALAKRLWEWTARELDTHDA